jgi:hypothetical protein
MLIVLAALRRRRRRQADRQGKCGRRQDQSAGSREHMSLRAVPTRRGHFKSFATYIGKRDARSGVDRMAKTGGKIARRSRGAMRVLK